MQPRRMFGVFYFMRQEPTRLILIRHAQTDANLNKRYSGLLDTNLNKNGKAQARKLLRSLKTYKIDRVYASNKSRTIETAKILFENKEVRKIPDLREMHFGIFEGLTYKEIMARHGKIYKKWLKDPYSVKIPDGESLINFQRRVVRAFREIVSLNRGKTVAVISHGGAISVFINYLRKSRKFWQKIPTCASLSIVEYNKDKTQIRLFNDLKHLKA